MGHYLQGDYLKDKHEIAGLSDLIEEIGPVFGRTFDRERKAWPYEIQRDRKWTLLKNKYSHSTNAMILFAMAVVSSRLRKSVLAPAVRPRKGYSADEDEDEAVKTAIAEGWQRLKDKCRTGRDFTESKSFGPDDP